MKKLVMLALLAAVLALGSCAPEPDNIRVEIPDGFMLAHNRAVDFYFYYPENFILDVNTAMISIFVSDHEFIDHELETEMIFVTPVNPNLSVTVFSREGGIATVDEWWSEFVLPSFRELAFRDILVESSEDVEVAGLPGRKFIYSFTLGGHAYRAAQVIFFRGPEVYTILYTATPGRFSAHEGVLEIVMDSFAFIR